MDRRAFVRATGAAAAAVIAGPRRGIARQDATTLFRNGLVYDGTGAAPVEADVLVAGDRILEVARDIRRTGAQEVDCRDHAVAPGFIDVHSHTDLDLFIDPRAESKVRQGVTTEVTGQDGDSIGPWTADAAAEMDERYRTRYGVALGFRDLGGFFERLEQHGTAVNLASMVGQGAVRQYVIGNEDRPADDGEIEAMQQLVAEALAGGACGLSSGLEYVPGGFASLAELVAVAQPLRGTGLPYASHMRNEDDQLVGAIEEALNVGRLAGVPVQIAHLKAQGQRNWWKAPVVLDMLERARSDGIDVAYDRYPYVAYSTGLTALFPVWSRDGGTAGLLSRLDDPAVAERIERDVREKIVKLGTWDAVQVTSTADSAYAWAEGRRLGTLAAERDAEPYTLLLTLIRGDRGRSGMVGFGMSEENTEWFLAHPLGMVCSDGSALAIDGPLASGTPHPRSFGTFPRVLGHYCRERRAFPLETAIHKMTGQSAARLRLPGRGGIARDMFADLVVFDPATVADRATFANPHQYPVGIRDVMVNGRFVQKENERTEGLPGRIVRPAGS
jgi:N-acyl-D-amino-acid deacylase